MNTQTIRGFFVDRYNKASLFFNNKFFRCFLYTSLFDLPLRNYIDLVVDAKYRKLLKVPFFAPIGVYKAVYAELIEEYINLSGNNSLKVEQEKVEDENELRKKIYLYSVGLSVLVQFTQNDGILSYFAEQGFTGDIETVVKKVDAELKVLNLELQALEQSKANNPKEKTTRAEYSKIKMVLGKNGYSISDDMSTADFIQALNLQREEIKSAERLKVK